MERVKYAAAINTEYLDFIATDLYMTCTWAFLFTREAVDRAVYERARIEYCELGLKCNEYL